ncbi:MAG: hypothetical protein K5739_08230 [Lachnospiraceae bacterium]|nr:hypothetical protein [Lachnospiraceae bacterium]
MKRGIRKKANYLSLGTVLLLTLLLSVFGAQSANAGFFTTDVRISAIRQTSLLEAQITWECDREDYDGFVLKKTLLENGEEYRDPAETDEYMIPQQAEEGITWTVIKTMEPAVRECTFEIKYGEKAYYTIEGYSLSAPPANHSSSYRRGKMKEMRSCISELIYNGQSLYVDDQNGSNAYTLTPVVPVTEITSIQNTDGSETCLTWQNNQGAKSIGIYCCRQNDGYQLIATVGADQTSYVHSGIKKGDTYSYYLITNYEAGYVSGKSDTRSVFVPNTSGKKKVVNAGQIKMDDRNGMYEEGNFATSDTTYYYQQGKNLYVVTVKGNKVTSYKVSSKMKVKSKKTVKFSKNAIFGGFYHGADGNNYLAIGYNNPAEDNTKVVIQVIQYDSSWKKKKTAEIKGGVDFIFPGIYEPFDASGCQMTMSGKWLVMATGRTMYMKDGCHHQSNIAFRIDTETMKASLHPIMYVSHSFNQLIGYAGDTLYQVDHGDAYPRCICITGIEHDTDLDDISYAPRFSADAFLIEGKTGENFTGVMLNGMGIGSENILTTGIAQPNQYPVKGITGTDWNSNCHNVFLTVTNRKTAESKVIWLTGLHPWKSKTLISEARMVTLSDDRFAIIWNEFKKKKSTLKYVVVDQKGNVICKKSYKNTPFDASSQPILFNGYIMWAVKNEGLLHRKHNEVTYSSLRSPYKVTKLVRIPAVF